jgi:hypothetical protein
VSHKWSLSFRFPHQYPVYASPPPLRAICPAEWGKTLLLNIAGDGTFGNHTCFDELNFCLFQKPVKIN